MLVENPQTNPQKKKKKSGLADSQKHLCSCSINLFIAAWRSSLLIKPEAGQRLGGFQCLLCWELAAVVQRLRTVLQLWFYVRFYCGHRPCVHGCSCGSHEFIHTRLTVHRVWHPSCMITPGLPACLVRCHVYNGCSAITEWYRRVKLRWMSPGHWFCFCMKRCMCEQDWHST